MIRILYEDNHLLVVEKPINIPVQEDNSHDDDLLSMLKKYIKNKYQKQGNVYLGLIHRLDRPVGGVMVFAKTSKAASRLSKQLQDKEIVKKYYAILEGKINSKGKLIDKLTKDSQNNTTYVSTTGKLAILEYTLLKFKNNLSLVDIKLETGRSHQIRVQFSSRNFPLYGDQRYNKNAKVGEQIALFAYYLSFKHPISGEKLEFEIEPPNRYPFSIFKIDKEDNYEQ